MWPMLLDMSRDECKRILRRLELEAYSSLVSAFRAQGDLNKEKKRILQDLQQSLSISTERHRAEVRRAINDEKLSTIADSMAGPNTESEWLIEGRRLIPLMPRLVPQTAFTVTANHAANIQAEKNASMPSPSHTGNKDVNTVSSPTTPVGSGISKVSRPSSPSSNVVVLPSGMSIHIKGGLNTEEDEEPISRKRRRSQSTETIVSPSAGTQTPRVTYTTTAASSVSGMSPMKITISKSPQGRSQVSTNITQSQKVILVSSSGQSPSVLQKSITVPVVKTVGSLAGSSGHSKASIILPNTSVTSSNGSLGNIVTVATPTMSTATSTCTTPTVVTTSTMTFLTPAVSVPKPRLKTAVPRQRFTTFTQAGQPKPGVVIPMGPQPVQPSPQNIQIKPVTKASSIQIRQEGGMKIITQSIPGGGTSKILPKPTQLSNSSGTPVVVVSAGSSTATSSVTMVTRPVTSIGQSGTKILNITQGGKVISGVNRSGNVVTVSPKTLHLTAVKSQSGGSGKPNVIVVQKTQPKKAQGGVGGTSKGTTIISSPFEKELVSFLQKQDSTKHIVVTTPGSQRTERKVIVTTPGQLEAVTRQRARSESEGGKTTSLLADLIHAAGIVPDSTSETSGDVTINLDEAAMAALSVSSQDSDTSTQSTTSQSLPNNEWFEYDVTDDSSQNYQTSGLESGVEIQTSELTHAKPKVTVQRSASVDLSQLDQLSQQQFYSIEQAMKILNQPNSEGTAPTLDPVSLLRMEGSESSQSDLGTSESQSSLTTDNAEVDTTTSIPSSQNSGEGSQPELEHLGPGLNFQGELDPQTGIFYTVAATSGSDTVVASTPSLERTQLDAPTQGAKTFDLLSSSLAQAQIDLDPYQFIEEDVLVEKTDSQAEVPTDQQPAIETTAVPTDSSDVTLSEEGSGGPIIHIKSSSFIPIQELSKSRQNATINITRHPPLAQQEMILPQEGGVFTEGVEVMGQEGTLDDLESHLGGSLSDSMSSGVSSNAVTVETAQMVDPADVRAEMSGLDDLGVVTSPSLGNSSDSQEVAGLDLSASLRMSKRKRKAPSNIDETPNQGQGSWIRSCIGLIQRVSRYRGLNREKGDLNAASWFTEPVDRNEVPDYYTIIKHPMDFGTIKKKLEANTYLDQEDFHTDMLLVRDNCRTYNPPGSTVRRDCDEVFAFYMSEYEKLLDKWQKAQISSPSPKKSRLDKSPVRP